MDFFLESAGVGHQVIDNIPVKRRRSPRFHTATEKPLIDVSVLPGPVPIGLTEYQPVHSRPVRFLRTPKHPSKTETVKPVYPEAEDIVSVQPWPFKHETPKPKHRPRGHVATESLDGFPLPDWPHVFFAAHVVEGLPIAHPRRNPQPSALQVQAELGPVIHIDPLAIGWRVEDVRPVQHRRRHQKRGETVLPEKDLQFLVWAWGPEPKTPERKRYTPPAGDHIGETLEAVEGESLFKILPPVKQRPKDKRPSPRGAIEHVQGFFEELHKWPLYVGQVGPRLRQTRMPPREDEPTAIWKELWITLPVPQVIDPGRPARRPQTGRTTTAFGATETSSFPLPDTLFITPWSGRRKIKHRRRPKSAIEPHSPHAAGLIQIGQPWSAVGQVYEPGQELGKITEDG